MKKPFIISFLISILVLGYSSNIQAIPAYPKPIRIAQPNGDSLTIRIHGDEFSHYLTTEDGYTILKNNKNYYVYATLNVNNELVASTIIASDINQRNQTDTAFLKSVKKGLYKHPVQSILRQKQANELNKAGILTKKTMTSSNFKGLVILAQFTDKKFSNENINEIITETVNSQNYTKDGFTGSVRDYFFDNSNGKFDPQFDIVGPVTLDYKQKDAKGTDNGQTLVRNACVKADELANFADYDLDNDGEVDMIYVIFAGGGSHAGNDEDFIWPHASKLYNSRVKLDGVYCNRYACSTELAGLETYKTRDGIGTVCHEFSHVLGLMDFYDTDYAESGGEADHPGEWSLMASGGYLNNSRTPCAYSAFERYTLGWETPTLITSGGSYSLSDLYTTQESFRINSAIDKEFFILENRQSNKWDKYLPGHGMLVFRVDSTNASVWQGNNINVNPKHMYYELLRASSSQNEAGRPFPGIGGVTRLSDTTTPNLKSWTGTDTEVEISRIMESNGVIKFNLSMVSYPSYIEDFEGFNITTNDASGLKGKFSNWTLRKANIVQTDKYGTGNRVIEAQNNSEIIMETPVDVKVLTTSYKIWNPSKNDISTRMYYSHDNGNNWITAYNSSVEAVITVEASSNKDIIFPIENDQPTIFKIVMSNSSPVYIDNFTIKTDAPLSVIPKLPISQKTLNIYTENGKIIVETSDNQSPIEIYTINGIKITELIPTDGRVYLELNKQSTYIIKQKQQSIKASL